MHQRVSETLKCVYSSQPPKVRESTRVVCLSSALSCTSRVLVSVKRLLNSAGGTMLCSSTGANAQALSGGGSKSQSPGEQVSASAGKAGQVATVMSDPGSLPTPTGPARITLWVDFPAAARQASDTSSSVMRSVGAPSAKRCHLSDSVISRPSLLEAPVVTVPPPPHPARANASVATAANEDAPNHLNCNPDLLFTFHFARSCRRSRIPSRPSIAGVPASRAGCSLRAPSS